MPMVVSLGPLHVRAARAFHCVGIVKAHARISAFLTKHQGIADAMRPFWRFISHLDLELHHIAGGKFVACAVQRQKRPKNPTEAISAVSLIRSTPLTGFAWARS